ncbi:hypothetical protein E2C01_013628 [Portunus trituberculatus]|uniref:Uncharacterized protein n=1 Tax=Portunus trituberculatus TaxID=210409 RepID=A0A5B7DHJ5_PORTR|nr:hypothetical protein [Portunus trituberculatus]
MDTFLRSSPRGTFKEEITRPFRPLGRRLDPASSHNYKGSEDYRDTLRERSCGHVRTKETPSVMQTQLPRVRKTFVPPGSISLAIRFFKLSSSQHELVSDLQHDLRTSPRSR